MQQLSTSLVEFGLPLMPFRGIKVEAGAPGLCIPGLGTRIYELCARYLFQVVERLLPNDDDAQIRSVVELVRTNGGNGFELLFRIGREVIGIFDLSHIPEAPTVDADGDLVVFANALSLYNHCMNQRNQPTSLKTQSQMFLNGAQLIPRFSGLASQLKLELKRIPDSDVSFPVDFEIDHLLFDLYDATSSHTFAQTLGEPGYETTTVVQTRQP